MNLCHNNLSRNLSIDLIKIAAMLGVLCLHATYPYIKDGEFGLANILYETAVMSIPLFFMVSGYLLLGRSDISVRYVSFKVLKIIRFTVIITLIAWLMYGLRHGFEAKSLVHYLCGIIQRGPLFHLWYLGAMCIVYILALPLNRLYLTASNRFYILFLLLLGFEQVVFTNNLFDFWPMGNETSVIQTFRLWNWLFYFMLGGIVKRFNNVKVPLWVIIALLILNILLQEWINPKTGNNLCEYFYSSIVVILLTAASFTYLLKIPLQQSRIIKETSNLFLPVYCIHIFVLNYISFHFDLDAAGAIAPLVCWVFLSAVSLVISYIVMKTPFLNRLFRL